MAPRRFVEKVKERLDKEVGTIYKPHADRLCFALAFPNTYRVGMSNLGIQAVYKLLNDREDSVCERVFLPDESDMEEFSRPGARLLTMESQSPVAECDLLAFSLSYELDYPNVLKILRLAGLSLPAHERTGDDPLVIAGGPAGTFNPETLAPFVDVFLIGEAEAVLPEFVDALDAGRELGRRELLERLATVEGVYVPSLYEPVYRDDGTIDRYDVQGGAPKHVKRRWVENLDEHSAASVILTPETEFAGMVLAEVARGCGRQCRFCIAGYAFLPPRSASAERVLEQIEKAGAGLPEEQRSRVGLMSASVFDHPSSLLICRELAERDRLFSISSTRADTLTADVAQALRRGGHETLTIAPEAGSNRLRRVINKVMTDEDVFRAASTAWESGFRRLKLYFMVGLPSETMEDVDGIVSLVKTVHDMHRWERIGVSVSCFVPKPWTPFQWAPMDDEKSLARKLGGVTKALRPIRGVELGGESPREAIVQGVLARGDRRLAPALLAVSTGEKNWRAAFRETETDPAWYANRPRHRDETLPWDVIYLGVTKDYLWREYERAMAEIPTSACAVGVCRRCGVCHG